MIERMPMPLLGGINVHDDPAALQDGQWQRLRNLAPRKAGIVGQRQSMSFVREVIPSWWKWNAQTLRGSLGVASAVEDYWRWAQNLRPVRFLFDPNWGEISMVCITTASTNVYDQTSSGVQTIRTVPDGTLLLITLPGVIVGNGAGNLPILRCAVLGEATRMPSLFTFNGETYAFAGLNNGSRVTSGTAAVDIVNFCYTRNDFGTANTDFNPDGACVVRDRVVYYKGSNLYWSDRNEPLVVAANGFSAADTRGIYLGGEELEPITAVAELSTSADGSPVQSVAAAWTKSRCYMLLGEPLETDDAGDILGSLQINRLNLEAGCVSQASIVRTPYGTLWAGTDDVWFMPYGSLPIRVGTSIRDYLEDQPAGLQWKIHAEYYDGFYRLSLFAPGQGPALYDPCGMQLWLDLRGGAPQSAAEARWYGPQVFAQVDSPTLLKDMYGQAGVYAMARDARATGDQRLYALQSFVFPAADRASVAGNVQGMSLCGFDTVDGRDTCAPWYPRTMWQASQTPQEGDIMVPRPHTTDRTSPVFVCTTGGNVGAGTEPDWFNISATGTVTDNGNVWTLRYWSGASGDAAMSSYLADMLRHANQSVTTDVEWSMLSKEFMLGDPLAEKLLDGAELGYWTQNPTQLTYNSHPKQDERSRVLTPNYEQTAANVANQTTGDRVWQRKLLTPDPTKRFHGLSAIWECEQDAGIVITSGVNNTIVFTYLGNALTTTITAGYYADLAAVVAAIVTAAGFIESTIAADGGYSRALVGLRAIQPQTLAVHTSSRLAQLLGYSPEQGATVSALSPAYAFGYDSPRAKVTPDMQISGINLRHKLFGRRPT